MVVGRVTFHLVQKLKIMCFVIINSKIHKRNILLGIVTNDGNANGGITGDSYQ